VKCGASQALLMPCGESVLGQHCGPIGVWRLTPINNSGYVVLTSTYASPASATLTRDLDNIDGGLWIQPRCGVRCVLLGGHFD
jgi:hypothetical protein